MTFVLHGLPVSAGIAVGRAHLISHATVEVAQYQIREQDIEREIGRFDSALAAVHADLALLRVEATGPGVPKELPAFVDVHMLLLEDPLLNAGPRAIIRERHCNCEWALVQQMETLLAQFEEMEDSYLRERKQDVVQVVERILKVLLGMPSKLSRRGREKNNQLIAVAHDISPSDALQFKQMRIGGFVTDMGGVSSHTAIIARSLGIPAVVGLHHARPLVHEDDLLIVDGTRGVLVIDPDSAVLEEYRERQKEFESNRSKLRRGSRGRAVTLDGVTISLQANIEMPQDVSEVRSVDAKGIGLFRTEFLFMNRDLLPSEDEQFEAYCSVIKAMGTKPVTIRTMDLGADKTTRALRAASDQPPINPALGQRAIRYCLAQPQLFLCQLRAILRASHFGNIRLLIPMLSHVKEIDQTLMMLWLAKEQLRDKKIPFNEDIDIGGMIEIPAAALALKPFLKRLDFLSIGTNDLIQYTLAIDRNDEAVSGLYDPFHPAVLKLIADTLNAGKRDRKPVAVCGELAGDPRMTKLLLGMGLLEFSMNATQIPDVHQQVIAANVSILAEKVTQILKLEEPEIILELIEAL